MILPYFEWLSNDGKLILIAKIIRTFVYGFLSIILAIYLKLIGFEDLFIGIIISSTLVSSVIFTLIASFYADKIGRRKTLIIYGMLMCIAGAIFTITSNPIALIAAALIGAINVTGSEIGAFLSIEQSILPQTIKNAKKQTLLYAIYNMAGTFAMSAGVLLSGIPEFLKVYGHSETESIKLLFIFYSMMGVVIVFIYIRLSDKVEQIKRSVQ